MGYHRAGFDVVGVDVRPQPRYPFAFVQDDALVTPLDGFDAIHASPPCQGYANVTRWRGDPEAHPRLIEAVRARLAAAGVPWVIENVRTPALRSPVVLCGTALGVRVRRHRYFELPWLPFGLVPPCRHGDELPFDHGGAWTESDYRAALGCEWMTVREARQAIPPAYTEWVGRELRAALG